MAELYCLECNQVIGEDPTGEDADREAAREVCQTCSQHVGLPEERASPIDSPP